MSSRKRKVEGNCGNTWYVTSLQLFSTDGLEAERVMSIELQNVWDRDIDLLSGGELQRFAIAMVCVQKADV
jgi:translation initiation factor RLI1